MHTLLTPLDRFPSRFSYEDVAERDGAVTVPPVEPRMPLRRRLSEAGRRVIAAHRSAQMARSAAAW